MCLNVRRLAFRATALTRAKPVNPPNWRCGGRGLSWAQRHSGRQVSPVVCDAEGAVQECESARTKKSSRRSPCTAKLTAACRWPLSSSSTYWLWRWQCGYGQWRGVRTGPYVAMRALRLQELGHALGVQRLHKKKGRGCAVRGGVVEQIKDTSRGPSAPNHGKANRHSGTNWEKADSHCRQPRGRRGDGSEEVGQGRSR